jgi:acyl-coenzyme A thioesterase PaaI-like protein
MAENTGNPAIRLQRLWQTLRPLPGGRWLFSRLLGWLVPYSGSIGAVVMELRPGYARLELSDRRQVRNHLHSVHAVALTNLGELTSGLALLTGLPAEVRGIPVHIAIEFHKKARGRLVAQSRCNPPSVAAALDFEVYADIHDASAELVAHTTVRWRLSPLSS